MNSIENSLPKYYFYCPKCKHEDNAVSLPRGTVGNIRGGYGTPIHHYECPKCGNLDAGYMRFDLNNMSELERLDQELYFRSVISMYQNIRGNANDMGGS